MSVIVESEKGDSLICIEEFTAAPRGAALSLDTGRTFQVGEKVLYESFYQHPNLADNPVCWMVVFEAGDGKSYAATQTFFVTEECWQGLKRFFARQRSKTPKSPPGSRH